MTKRVNVREIDAAGYVGDGSRVLADDGTWKAPGDGSGSGVVETIVAGTGIAVDSTDPANPVVSATGGAGSVPLLARKTFSAGAAVTGIITTSTSMVDADATNLVVTFTVPPSGTVKVRLEGLGGGVGNPVAVWGVREGSTTLQEAQVVNGAASALFMRVGCEFIVTGLTPRASKTYKWGHYNAAGGGADARIYTGGSAGAAIMSVFDASMI